ncbi:hypothetical protein FCM30_18460 [Lelliottia aquatilis]|uniref:type 4b pilus protein PilO2 n=1 Tax=Lelliottia aquatilis TaxID=2080838 RepID=UPI0015764F30|nr:type 4b pilus protein PilO2 [Lelliottia aquatilis]NTZ47725.1 hypothetical protein [Lelliottia aquatilis]
MLKIRPPVLLRSGRVDYACGLVWQPSPRKGWREAVRAARAVPGADHYLQMTTPAGVLTGLTHLNGVRHQRVVSLAAIALSFREGDWLGIFQTSPERYWFIAIINGGISPLSDVTGDLKAVQSALVGFLQFRTAPDFVVAPPEFALPDSQPMAWIDLTARRAPKSIRLSPLSLKKPVFLMLFLILLTGGGWHAFNVWQAKQQEAALAAQREAIQARLKAQHQLAPWKKVPTAAAFLAACSSRYRALSLSVRGWKFSAAECRAEGMRVAYTRNSPLATASDFAQHIQQRYHVMPGFNLQNGAKVADFILPYAGFSPTDYRDDVLNAGNEAAFPLVSFFQQWDLAFRMAPVAPQANKILPWKNYTFSITSSIPPAVLLSQMPSAGVRVNSVRLTLTSGLFNYETQGDFYAKN